MKGNHRYVEQTAEQLLTQCTNTVSFFFVQILFAEGEMKQAQVLPCQLKSATAREARKGHELLSSFFAHLYASLPSFQLNLRAFR